MHSVSSPMELWSYVKYRPVNETASCFITVRLISQVLRLLHRHFECCPSDSHLYNLTYIIGESFNHTQTTATLRPKQR